MEETDYLEEQLAEVAIEKGGLRSAYAVAFTCMIAFMGIGLVDPILKTIAQQLDATPAQTTLLFTSYMLVTGVMMLFTGFISSRIGAKKTLIFGLIIIIMFSCLAGFSETIKGLIYLRAGWGLGNALFISTALSAIVGVLAGQTEKAIIMYEASMGLGMSIGPLLGGVLGSASWRLPFFGVAFLMFIATLAISFLLTPIVKPKEKVSIFAGIKALKNHKLRSIGVIALLYNFGFFTLLAYAPFLLEGFTEMQVGFVFFGWGALLAVASVFIAPILEKRINTYRTILLALFFFLASLFFIGLNAQNPQFVAIGVIIAGFFQGLINTLLTTIAMEIPTIERSVASSSYSFIRFFGGAIAPFVAGKLAETWNSSVTFYFAALMVLIGLIFVIVHSQYFATEEEYE
ncbi:major facilitator superfamily transporter [Enterococcus moraviensis ATCC BAA-383]|uniref:Major facilitator superfamily transporter n=1 Tax=Enterococcus moraviensis ATCC BAA-383 TaxID=1158609 RepID=R2QW28_9ENTE|nr:MFS transporter [Enterococcus moraviensis]EOI00740.1 major facilitator superfamily transporter [Enterococcus moraviensis ATCC BAA-383]EOT73031.1 major facilitator superfamily transporter [Enterococcus moraviensis ATCC BAA-383]OJG64766.1 major facilitator superfamily transporter [Enterococcus moraviensis]